MRDKRDVMRLHIKNGIRDLDGIRSSYNEFKRGGGIDIYGNPITSTINYNPEQQRSNYNSRFDEINLGSDSNNNLDAVIAHENRHSWQTANDRTNFDITHNTINKPYQQLLQQPLNIAPDEQYFDYHNRKAIESQIELTNVKNQHPELRMVGDDFLMNKVVDKRLYNNPYSKEGEAQFYQETGKKSF